jgi:PIN domain nuclease of toxin-antitoxin system
VILLDTHVVAWSLLDAAELGKRARLIVTEAIDARTAAVSAIMFWELGILIEKRQLSLAMPLTSFAEQVSENIQIIPVDKQIAVESGSLPTGIHGDPGDRIIAAAARILGCPLLTADKKLLAYAAAGHLQAIDARL